MCALSYSHTCVCGCTRAYSHTCNDFGFRWHAMSEVLGKEISPAWGRVCRGKPFSAENSRWRKPVKAVSIGSRIRVFYCHVLARMAPRTPCARLFGSCSRMVFVKYRLAAMAEQALFGSMKAAAASYPAKPLSAPKQPVRDLFPFRSRHWHWPAPEPKLPDLTGTRCTQARVAQSSRPLWQWPAPRCPREDKEFFPQPKKNWFHH